MEAEYGKELELWTGVTSHEIIDNVDSLEWEMEAKLKTNLLRLQEEELSKVLEFLKERVDESHALTGILDEYMSERSNLVQKLTY